MCKKLSERIFLLCLLLCGCFIRKSHQKTVCIRDSIWEDDYPETCREQNTTVYCTDEYPKSFLSTNVVFEHDGVDVSYAKRFEIGTIAKFRCAYGFQRKANVSDVLECTADGWKGTREPCKMKCGRAIDDGWTFPWHLSIYKKVANNFENICGGTLISPRLVVTAAHCFVKDRKDRSSMVIDNTKFVVAAGKTYRQYHSAVEPKAVMRRIADIWIPVEYAKNGNDSYGDIAVLMLAKFLPFSQKIQPLCLFNNDHELNTILTYGFFAKMPIWNKTEVLSKIDTLSVYTISNKECKPTLSDGDYRILSNDKFCLTSGRDDLNCINHFGSGLVLQKRNTIDHTLVGIINVAPAESQDCGETNFLIVTQITKYLENIKKFLKHDLEDDMVYSKHLLKANTHKSNLTCEIPPRGHTDFTDNVTGVLYDIYEDVPALTVVNVSCNDADYLLNSDDNLVTCRSDGLWSADFPYCEVWCGNHHPEHDLTTVFELEFNGRRIDNHTAELRHGTKALVSCAPGFEKPAVDFTEISTCTTQGWLPKRKPCVKDCRVGVDSFFGPHPVDHISSGPWHIGIFYKTDFPARYICEGNLISTRLMITAFSCLLSTANGSTIDLTQLVAVGGYYPQGFRNFSLIESSVLQKRDIKQIWKADEFYNVSQIAGLGGDIAVLQIFEPFRPRFQLNPMCINYDAIPDLPLAPQTHGYMFYWHLRKAFDRPLIYHETLRLSTLSKAACETALAPCALTLKSDQFCLRITNGNADDFRYQSYGGFSFRIDTSFPNVYVLSGIRSMDQQNDCKHSLLIMTDVFYYKDFIETLLEVERKAGYAH